MKNILYLSAIILFCACHSEKNESTQAVIHTPNGINGLQKHVNTPITESEKRTLIYNPAHGKPGHTCALAVGAPLHQTAAVLPQKLPANTAAQATPVAVSSTQNTAGKKLNPKHGEPGHRCDIAVGAPLDAKPAALATSINSQPVVTKTVPQKVAKGMNPPHGQPNHRCDIAVGAPLTAKAVVTPAAIPVKAPEVTSGALETPQTGARLNPKHGDSGHRCDIAVGAPLT